MERRFLRDEDLPPLLFLRRLFLLRLSLLCRRHEEGGKNTSSLILFHKISSCEEKSHA